MRNNGPIDPEDHIDIESVRHLVTTVNPREMGVYCQNQESLFELFLFWSQGFKHGPCNMVITNCAEP